MPSITSLINRLEHDYPDIDFVSGNEFRWSPTDKAVIYEANSDDTASLLHELAHSLLQHASYTKDLRLLEMERDAWSHAAKELAPEYEVDITDKTVDSALDSYRDWLHSRSTCPKCEATGIQTKQNEYKCLACRTNWRVNEARVCELRRYVAHT
jgi:hypothetical protein